MIMPYILPLYSNLLYYFILVYIISYIILLVYIYFILFPIINAWSRLSYKFI
jgi:hypothetical protein